MGKNLNKNEEKQKKNPVSKQPLNLAPEYSRDHNTNYENISNTVSMTVRHKGHGQCCVCLQHLDMLLPAAAVWYAAAAVWYTYCCCSWQAIFYVRRK